MNVLIVVPARSGSKGIPGKNLRQVGGLSLLARAVVCGRLFAERQRLDGATVVVDTDGEDLAAEGRTWLAEVPFLRPAELARDATSTWESLSHTLARWQQDHGPVASVVLLQPTSPLRMPDDVEACWTVHAAGAASVVSVTRFDHPPEQALRVAEDGTTAWAFGPPPGTRRQDFAPSWRVNGAVYVQSPDWLRRHGAFVVPGESRAVAMPAERSVDVDRPEDLLLAEVYWRGSAPAVTDRYLALDGTQPPDLGQLRSRGVTGLVVGGPAEALPDLAQQAAAHGLAVVRPVHDAAEVGRLPERVIPLVSAGQAGPSLAAAVRGRAAVWLQASEAGTAVALEAARLAPTPVTLVGSGLSAYRGLASLAQLAGVDAGLVDSPDCRDPDYPPRVRVEGGMVLARSD